MLIHWSYVALTLITFSLGFLAGWKISPWLHELRRMKRVIRAKSPELWDNEHYVAVDELKELEAKRTKTLHKKS